ncbi:MAG: ferrous iron transporter B [Defluviitaleaceae bacterium]|nr:ferrous iron transporter B [Defluviitaleaceae bacterium]
MRRRILLMGNPNVGKSIFFTELTGIHAMSANYTGTTVSFMEGKITVGGEEYTLIDVPGTYSMTPTSEAEAVAEKFMQEGAAAVICVLDASNLERNLKLAMEMMQYNIPMVFTLNMMDVAERHGVLIDVKLLEEQLNAPVIKSVAVKGKGLEELITRLEILLKNKTGCGRTCEGCPWAAAKEICTQVRTVKPQNPGFLDKLGDAMLNPFPGLPIAVFVLALLVGVVVFGGRGLRMPLIMLTDGLVVPFFRQVIMGVFSFFTDVENMGGFTNILLEILIGEYGIFVISFQWIIALILPYVFAFYVGITFLEDSGYLPRLSVLFDNIMRKLGVQGGSLIHVFLALGCAVPAILGSRTATTKKERIMIVTIVCFAIPCISQVGALIALLSAFSWWMTPAMVLFAMFMFTTVAFIANKVIKGKVDPLILEIPNLLLPNPKTYFRKLAIRMKHFVKDAEFPMLIAVFIAAILAGTGIITIIAQNAVVQNIVSGWLGMPQEAVVALILGIVRREMSVAPLIALDLTYLQVFVAGVVSLLYLPCLSVFGVVAKEFKTRVAVIIFLGTIFTAIFVGGVVNQIARLFM